jgi:hypothetical protein
VLIRVQRIETLAHLLLRMQNCAVIQQFPKMLFIEWLWLSHFTPVIYPRESSNTCSQEFRAALFIIAKKWGKTKEKINISYNQILLDNKKWSSDICYNMNEPWKHPAKWNKPDMKDHMLYCSTYIKCSKQDPTETRRRGNCSWWVCGNGHTALSTY